MKKTLNNFWSIGVGAVILLALLLGSLLTVNAQVQPLMSQLSVGARGAEVTKLQTFLATDALLYPSGLVTGYFGPLTEQGVTNFQIRYGISAVGRVGPITLVKINEVIGQGGLSSGGDNRAPIIMSITTGVGANAATINWNTSENARSKVYYSTSPLSMMEAIPPATEPTISGSIVSDPNLKSAQSITLGSLSSNTTYYYVVMSTDQYGNVMMTMPFALRTTQ